MADNLPPPPSGYTVLPPPPAGYTIKPQQAIAEPEGNPISRFVKGAWDYSLAGIPRVVGALVDLAGRYPTGTFDPTSPSGQMITGLVQAHYDQAVKAKKAYDEGRYSEAAGHTLATILPLVGPAAAAAGEEFGGTRPQYDRFGNVVVPGKAPDIARGLGATTGLVGSVVAPEAVKAAAPVVARAVSQAADSVQVPSRLNPVQQSAVEFLESRDVPLNAGTITGNRFVKGAQALAQNQPLGAGVAARASRATEVGLTRVAGELADEAHPVPVTPESAGQAVPTALKGKISELGLQEDAAYQKAWQGRDNPQFTYQMPVGTQDEAVLDAQGKPTGAVREVPRMGKVNMPVDVRDIKAALRPVWDEMQWMPASDRASSAGYTAVKNILEGDDFIPAWQAEKGLSGLKTMARVTNNSGVRNASQGIGASIIPELQDGIDAAVANTGEDAIRGLQQGRAFHANKMEIADLADQLRQEPVQAFGQLTWRNDTGIDFLRKIDSQVPDVLPKVGRAFVQQLFDQATQEGGFGRARTLLNRWEELGPETKKLLFRSLSLRENLDNFFKGAAMVAENPNPSGTAVVGSLIPGGMLAIQNPVAGTAWLLGGYGAAKLLFSPRGVALLTKGLQPAADAADAAAQVSRILEAAGNDAKPITPPGKGGGPEEPPPATPGPGGAPGSPGGPGGAPAGNPGGGRSAAPGGSTGATAGNPGAMSAEGGGTVRSGVDHGETGTNAGGAGEGPAVSGSNGSGGTQGAGSATIVRVPGSKESYRAQYEVREIGELQPSHNGLTFQPNPQYGLKNQRDYSAPENQRKVLEWSTPEMFEPDYHVTNNPDASNGPPVIDGEGNGLGGNGRLNIMQRVYAYNPKGAAAYRQLLIDRAQQFGLDPKSIEGMKQPVLVRRVLDEDLADAAAKDRAIGDFNIKGTAELRPNEAALADSRRVSGQTLEDLGTRLDSIGPEATLADAMEGSHGPQILQDLIRDGVISPQEQAKYVYNERLTPAARERISQLMLGRFFRDTDQLARTPAAIRGKLERMAAPLAKVEGDRAWTLTPHLQEALDLLSEARAHDMRNIGDFARQSSVLGDQAYSPQAIVLAKALDRVKPTAITKMAREYAQDARFAAEGSPLFGEPPTPDESFEAAFGK